MRTHAHSLTSATRLSSSAPFCRQQSLNDRLFHLASDAPPQIGCYRGNPRTNGTALRRAPVRSQGTCPAKNESVSFYRLAASPDGGGADLEATLMGFIQFFREVRQLVRSGQAQQQFDPMRTPIPVRLGHSRGGNGCSHWHQTDNQG
jgi:hypothetical protein